MLPRMKAPAEKSAVVLLAVVAASAMFYSALFLNARSIQWDTLDIHYPLLAFFSRNVQSGTIPLWDPHLFCGCPFSGDLQAGAFFPVNFAAALCRVITPRIMIFLTVFSYAVALVGLWFLARFLGLSRGSASFSAITWVFSGQILGHATHLGILQIYSFLPWILMIAAASWKNGSVRFAGLSGILMGWTILAGHFQTAMYCFVFWLSWLSLGIFLRRGRLHTRIFQTAGCLIAATLLCLAGTSIQLFATADLASQSPRSSISSALTKTENLHFGSLATLFVPDVQGGINGDYSGPWSRTNQQCYAGLPTPALWIAGVICALAGFRRKKSVKAGKACEKSPVTPAGDPISRNSFQLFLLFWSIFGFMFALGPLTPVHEWTLRVIPGWDLVRTPSAILPLTYLTLAILAGIGLDWIASFLSARNARVLLFLIPLLTLAHLIFVYRDSDLVFGKTPPYGHFQPSPHRDFLDARNREDPNGFRIHEWDIHEVLLTNEASWKGWYSTGGRLSGLHLKNLGNLLRLTQFKRDVLDILRARYILTGTKPTETFVVSTRMVPKNASSWEPRVELNAVQPGIYHNPNARSVIFPVTQWEVLSDDSVITDRMMQINLNHQVILDEAPDFPSNDSSLSWSFSILRYELHKLEFSYSLDKPAILVAGDSYTPDWLVSVDGFPVKMLRANLALRAISAPAGSHVVSMTYQPFSYRIGVFFWLLGAGFTGLLLISFPSSNSSQKCHRPGS